MPSDLVKDDFFAQMMQRHIEELLFYLFESGQNFGVLCRIEHLDFDPVLPKEISRDFRPMTLFYLAGYTYDTARVEGDYLTFEAGFGEENIGSFVTVPLLAIMQIIVDETPLLINHATYREPAMPLPEIESEGIENSMQAFLNNPENQKFLKKK